MSSWGPLSGVAAGVLQASFGQQGEALRVLDRLFAILFARRAVSVPVNKQVFNGMGTGICNRTCGEGGVKVEK